MSNTCLHLGASSVGYAEAPIERADPSVAGMVLRATVCTCADCGDLVVGVTLRPKAGGLPTLVTPGRVSLVPIPASSQLPPGGVA